MTFPTADTDHILAPLIDILLARRVAIAATTFAFGVSGAIISLVMTPTYTAKASFLAPSQNQNSASAALAALGNLGALGGLGAGALKTPSDQYVSLMESVRVGDRIIDRFKLVEQYGVKFKQDARIELDKKVKFTPSKKDSFIFVEVEDESPERAAQLANAFVEELQNVTASLALTEAQQRRIFFEKQLTQTKERLTQAQTALESAGFGAGSMNTDAKATAELYAKARAQLVAAQIQLDSMRRSLAESAPEIQQQQSIVAGLTAQVRQLERPVDKDRSATYVSAYRDFKYQETVFEIYAKQFEAAKLDEAREAPLIQVIDVATPPEKRSKPKRVSMTLVFAAFGLLFASLFALMRHFRALPAEQRAIP